MDRDDLITKITNAIKEAFLNGNPEYTHISFDNSYFGSNNDIKIIGKKVVKNFNLNVNCYETDKMESFDYYIFKYMNLYIIINFYCDVLAWGLVNYKLLIVKTRDEALRYRYGG